MGFLDPIIGGISLRIPAIRSPNYVQGSSGWTINIDGSAEFNNGTFRGTVTAATFQGTDFVINSAGAFFYSGTPADGNLIASVASTSGTDTFGNAYVAGVTAYNTTSGYAANLESGSLSIGLATNLAGGANFSYIVVGDKPYAQATSPVETSGDTDALDLLLQPGTPGNGATQTGSPPTMSVIDDAASSAAQIQASGALVRVSLDGNTPYTWQTPSFNTNWAGGSSASSTYPTLRYRLTGEDSLWIYGCAHATAATPSATVFSLPAGIYRPVGIDGDGTTNCPAGALVSTTSTDTLKLVGRLNVMTTGQVVTGGFTIASGDNFYFNHVVPLGQIG